MKKRIIRSLLLLLMIITMSAVFLPSNEKLEKKTDLNMIHPEAGYIESIGN